MPNKNIKIFQLLKFTVFLILSFIPISILKCGEEGGGSNTKPIAVIAQPNPVGVGDVVLLDGSESSDPDGDRLTYHWSFDSIPAGSQLDDDAFYDNNSSTASTTSIIADAEGIIVIKLVVNDGELDSDSDFAIIEVSGISVKPIADAGEDVTVWEGQFAYLDGSGSYDTQGLPLTYNWSILSVPEGSNVTDADIIDADTETPSFLTDTTGIYTISLVVNNGVVNSDPDFVFVTALSTNREPIADAGEDIEAFECTTVILDGSGSIDPDHDPLSYEWSFITVPMESKKTDEDIVNADTVNPSFYLDTTGLFILQLVVFDGEDYSNPDIISVESIERDYNNPPQAEAGPDISVYDSAPCYSDGYNYYCSDCPAVGFNIDGTSSSDPDSDEISYYWWSSSSDVVFSNAYEGQTIVSISGASATYGETTTTTYTIYLTITDCMGATSEDYFTVTYECEGV